MLAFTFLAAILLSNKNFMKLAGTQFYFSINKPPENTAFFFLDLIEDKTAALSFHATVTIPVGLFSNVSANVSVIILPFFKSWLCCFCSLHKKELMQKCFSHLVRSFEEKPKALTCPLFPVTFSLS